MAHAVLTATQKFIARVSPLISSNVTNSDWMGFLDALGWMENNGKYGGLGGYNNAYAGMYQVGADQLDYMRWKTDIGKQLFGITTKEELAKNPVAEDIAAILEFSGIPAISGTFLSKFASVKDAFVHKGLSEANFN